MAQLMWAEGFDFGQETSPQAIREKSRVAFIFMKML